MAASVVTVTVAKNWSDSVYHVLGTVAIAAGDYAAGGLAVSLALSAVKSQRAPRIIIFQGTGIYFYKYIASTGKIFIMNDAGELATAATPAGVVADVVQFYAIFDGML